MAEKIYGAIAAFKSDTEILEAARKVRLAGYTKFDCHTPFPVHHLDQAMGMKRSKLPYFILGGTVSGFLLGLLLQWWTGAVDYKLVIGGKPLFALEFATPILFECTILLTAFAAVIGMIGVFNGLPLYYHPIFNAEISKRITDDRFLVSIEAKDPQFDATKTVEFLNSLPGAEEVQLIEA
jgi:hypothetical protein